MSHGPAAWLHSGKRTSSQDHGGRAVVVVVVVVVVIVCRFYLAQGCTDAINYCHLPGSQKVQRHTFKKERNESIALPRLVLFFG